MGCFSQTGQESLVAEAIGLHREALSLRPPGHPDRSMSCTNLANSLLERFELTGEVSLFPEAIHLQREALLLRPKGHPYRCMTCNNLANALWTFYKQTGHEFLLIEAIGLHREALSLRPSGHPLRSTSCTNLAVTLGARFEETGEEFLLSEAIALSREALLLRPGGHPRRLESCNELAALLKTLFDLKGDESLLVEVIDLHREIIETQPQDHPGRWKIMIYLTHIYLNRRFSQYNVVLALEYLQQALSLISDNWLTLLSEVAHLVSLFDLSTLSQESVSQLLPCFSGAIDLAFRAAGFVLDASSQLRYLKTSQHLGPRAYWCAIACGQPQLGLELIERSRAMMWTQSLHMRDPQLTGAPTEVACELELLLRRMYTPRSPNTQLSPAEQDVRHKDATRIHQLIQQIRDIPGCENFMRGLSFTELAQCASHNTVVLLVATEGECHALILQPNNREPVMLKLSDVVPDELSAMSIVESAAQRRGHIPETIQNRFMGVKVLPYQKGSRQTRSNPVLEELWKKVVKPIIGHLRLQVCTTITTSSIMSV
jgi:hypothetical protein